MRCTLQAVWDDALPGFIAAGVLSAAERFLIGEHSWTAPLFGLLTAGTVYAADHRVQAQGRTKRFTWLRICAAAVFSLGILFASPRLSVGVCSLYVLLALGYVIPLPGRTFRFQDHPWLRVGLISIGWGAIPFILTDLPPSSGTFGFCMGTTGLFFSGVFFSDLADEVQDRTAGRRTPVQELPPEQIRTCICLGTALSCIGYVWAGFPVLMVPALLGLGLLPCLGQSRLIRFADLLLLWPGAVVIQHML